MPKPRYGGRIGGPDYGGKHLERHDPIQLLLNRAIDDAHSSVTENAGDLVSVDLGKVARYGGGGRARLGVPL